MTVLQKVRFSSKFANHIRMYALALFGYSHRVSTAVLLLLSLPEPYLPVAESF